MRRLPLARSWRLRARALQRETAATALLEMALVLPLLLGLGLAALDIGRYLFLRSTLLYAAQEGAAVAAVRARTVQGTAPSVVTTVRGQIIDTRAAQAQVELTYTGTVPTLVARVTIRNYPFTPVTPGVGWLKMTPTTITVMAESHYELQDL